MVRANGSKLNLFVLGRLTLLKSVLGSIGMNYLSFFPVPLSVLHSLESLKARFFWGAYLGKRRTHKVSWDRVLASKKEGGLGVGSLFAYNKALIFKWLYFYVCFL